MNLVAVVLEPLHFWRMLAGNFEVGMNGCGRSEALPCDRVLWLAAGSPPASHPPKISWPHHPNPTSLRPFLTATVKSRLHPDLLVCLASCPGTVLTVWCPRRLTFISWCQVGTEALWPWMSGHARHEPAVPFRQPNPTRAHDTPQCLCVVWATSPRTPPARRLLSGLAETVFRWAKSLACQVGRRLCWHDGPAPPGRGPTQVGEQVSADLPKKCFALQYSLTF